MNEIIDSVLNPKKFVEFLLIFNNKYLKRIL